MAAPEHESGTKRQGYLESRYVLGAGIGGIQHPGGGQISIGDMPGRAKTEIAEFKRLNRNAPDDFGSNRLEGLVALMSAYVRTAQGATLGYAKTIAPLMARTDFAAMFSMLRPSEQAYLTEQPRRLLRLVHMASGVDPSGDFFPHGIYRNALSAGGGDPHALDGLTIRQWVLGVASGVDYLTAAHFNENPALGAPDPTARKPDFESMGALGNRTERVGRPGHRRRAPIFELRSLGQLEAPVAHAQALAVFDYLVELNAHGKRARLTLDNDEG